jgi:transposase-like protein
LKERGLKGVRLFISDKWPWLMESLGEFYPEAIWQRCAAHWKLGENHFISAEQDLS